MTNDTATLNTLWSELIVEELCRNGVDTFVISPGSRSAPLTAAAARNGKAKTVVHYDERGAAFFALGVAKALGAPCALICTSGTAVANYFPAIVEASMSYVPLIVLTADRPPELQHTGANQTIDQTRIYGEYVRHFAAMPCPDDKVPPEFVLTTIDHAVAASQRFPGGPVHINCAFREPLAPVRWQGSRERYVAGIRRWMDSNGPHTCWKAPYVDQDFDDVLPLVEEAIPTERLLVVVGREPERAATGGGTASTMLDGLFVPTILADVLSTARVQSSLPTHCEVIANYDLLLLSPRFREMCRPETVVHIGGPLISKRLMEHLAAVQPRFYIHVADHPNRLDPNHRVTHRIQTTALDSLLDLFPHGDPGLSPWMLQMQKASDRAEETVQELVQRESGVAEPVIARLLGTLLAQHGCNAVFAGNSMPVRYLDMYGGLLAQGRSVVANRGVSGIDGNIATAAGYAKASGVHVTALIGDLAALHDLNSLALLKQDGVRVTLVILNNDGGGIFHFLPIAEHGDVFEKYFATPHGMRFADAARMFGLPYAGPTTKDEFVGAFKHAHESGGSSIIEVITNREENLRLHRTISDAVVKALEDL